MDASQIKAQNDHMCFLCVQELMVIHPPGMQVQTQQVVPYDPGTASGHQQTGTWVDPAQQQAAQAQQQWQPQPAGQGSTNDQWSTFATTIQERLVVTIADFERKLTGSMSV